MPVVQIGRRTLSHGKAWRGPFGTAYASQAVRIVLHPSGQVRLFSLVCSCSVRLLDLPLFSMSAREREGRQHPDIECGRRNGDIDRLLGDLETRALAAQFALLVLKRHVEPMGDIRSTDELGRIAGNYRTYYNSHTDLEHPTSEAFWSYQELYTFRGTPPRRILCVNEKPSAWENRMQSTYRGTCQANRFLQPVFLSAESANKLIICPQFWQYPEKPEGDNQDDCPTVTEGETRFNTRPDDRKLILYQSYFLFAGAVAFKLSSFGRFPLRPERSLPISPNICIRDTAATSFSRLWCEVFFVASKYSCQHK